MSLRRWSLPAGLAIIALANAAILGRVAWNRSGTADRIVLTERELKLPYREMMDEDTGVALSFNLGPEDGLDETSLRRLGFDPDAKVIDSTLHRTGFAVFEMDGESWRRWLREREAELREPGRRVGCDWQSVLKEERQSNSRLLPVDTGTDADELRRRYPDRGRFLILPVTAYPFFEQKAKRFRAALELRVPEVHVPLELRSVIGQVLREDENNRDKAWQPHAPRYRATVAVGPDDVPWLTAVERLAAPPAGSASAPAPAPPGECPG